MYDYEEQAIFVVLLINAIDSLLSYIALSSTTEAFNEECAKLHSIFSRLDYPWSLTESVISNFDPRNHSVSITERNTDKSNIVS